MEKNKFLRKKKLGKKNFGKDNPFQKDSVREKVKKNNLEKYGVECALQAESSIKAAHNSILKKYGKFLHRCFYKIDNLEFDSWWEVCFYIKNRDEGAIILREPKAIPYFRDGKEHLYFVDFEVNGKLFEIKSDYWISRMSNEKKELIYNNNITIISNNEIKPFIDYVESTYPNLKQITRN